ncbi:MAG TPA: DUF1385 domain-containing protein [bacterium]|nr:DUF1385 domain-containing protein [bacterium]
MSERLLIGGQAVMEGVMMRSPHWTATAVRRPDGDILTSVQRLDSLLVRYPWLRLPVLRGIIVLYEALTIGIRALFFSANAALGEEEQLTASQIGVSAAVGLALAVGLFFVLPTIGARALDRFLPSVVLLNLVEGAIRVSILIAYIGSIARLPDIRRVYAYHGAEHKAVNAYEAGDPLDVAAVRRHSRFHPRCGTSFLLIVMVVAIIVFSFLGRPPLVLRIASRVALIPLVAGVSYEIIRAGARYRWFRPLVAPGMWLQRLTTREPDEAQMEVAARALREVTEREGAQEPAVA